MVRDRLPGGTPAGVKLVDWVREQWADDESSRSTEFDGEGAVEGEAETNVESRRGDDAQPEAASTTSQPPTSDSPSTRTDGDSVVSSSTRTAPDGGNPPAWEGDDPIDFDDEDDGQSLLDAVTAEDGAADTAVDLAAELADAATSDETTPTPEDLLQESTRGESRRSESTTAADDGESGTELSWSEAVDELIEEEADAGAPADTDTGAQSAPEAGTRIETEAGAGGQTDRTGEDDGAGSSIADDGGNPIEASNESEPSEADEERDPSAASDGTDSSEPETETVGSSADGEVDRSASTAESERSTPEAGEHGERSETEGAETGEESADSAAEALADRIDDIESEHEQVSTSVSSLETELDELRGDVNGIRSDLGTLVDLVKQTSHTRGATASEPAAESAQSEAAAPTPAGSDASHEAGETPSASTEDGPGGAEPTVDERTIDDQSESARANQADEATSLAEEQASQTDEQDRDGEQSGEGAAPDEDRAVDSDSSSDGDRDVADPRSDAVGGRLLQYRKQFTDGGAVPSEAAMAAAASNAANPNGPAQPTGSTDATDTTDTAEPATHAETAQTATVTQSAAGTSDPPAADGFQFQKLLVPADGDGEPELVGEDLQQPYLDSLPNGYAAEALVIEWLDGLVSESDQETAVQALAYYQSIGWIGGAVRRTLVGYLSGLGEIDEDELPDEPPAALDLADHRRTLEYVTHLATGEVSDDGI